MKPRAVPDRSSERSRLRRAAAVAASVLACALPVSAARAAELEFPLGPWVRAGRPVVVRVADATRVRGGGSPWALPCGAHGDEFVLQLPRADLTLRELEIDRDGTVRRVPVAVRALPEPSPVTAVFGDAGPCEVSVPRAALPTVREAWLVFDQVGAEPGGLAPAEANALAAWRAGPRPGTDTGAFEPLAWGAGAEPFRAAAVIAARAPGVPRDVALVLWLVAAAEASLLLLAGHRRGGVRALWLAGPPLAALLWLVAGDRLPGSVRAVMVRLDGPAARLVVVRFDAPRGGDVAFRVPDGATHPAILRYDADDRSASESSAGREVRLTIPPGQSRLVAWSLPLDAAAGTAPGTAPTAAPAPWPGDVLTARLGLVVTGAAAPASEDAFASRRGFRPVEGAAVTVASADVARK